MKKLILAFATLTSLNAAADVFADYQASGTKALSLALNSKSSQEEIVQEIKTMIKYGYQIMDLYQVKFTECTEQFVQLKTVDSTLSQLSYDQIDKLYHDGEGLVAAPRTCYKGRSLVVHPYQVIALALENRLQSEKATVDHEMNEVIERAGKIKTTLGL